MARLAEKYKKELEEVANRHPKITEIEGEKYFSFLEKMSLSDLRALCSEKSIQARRCAHKAMSTGSSLYSRSADRLHREVAVITAYLRLIEAQDEEIDKALKEKRL